ncbi:unnamed protein product [Rotaria socialis]|uniref:NAD(P)(+)--arginine ADP-ribosyltransferase n=1 Tax=Rotaria socialis TaxID=392032 RepID=A0A817NS36_9BILA|nr:unnamed protein product [Rotaria socialis]
MATAGGGEEAAVQRVLRFSDVVQEPLEILAPIGGYSKVPLVSLEEAVKPLVPILPDVQAHAYVAKLKCKKPADNLTQDESASIMLYTMGWEPLDECLYVVLNDTLRAKNRQQQLPFWYLYLRLFLNALFRLPLVPAMAYRGVRLDLSNRYIKGESIVWWGFSSCTTSVDVLDSEIFLGKTGKRTMFTLQCKSTRDISQHSFYPAEDEVLLMAATQFKVKGCLTQGNLYIIQLEETIPPFPLLQPVPIIGSLSIHSNPPGDSTTTSSCTSKDETEKSSAKPSPSKHVAAADNSIIGPMSTVKITASTNKGNIPANAKWAQNGVTIAGGHGSGDATDQLNEPHGLFVDDDQTVVIVEWANHRIVQWKNSDTTNGQVVAGGNDQGNGLHQLNHPTDVLIDKEADSLIICDYGNRRVVRWSRLSSTTKGEMLIDNIQCYGVAMDEQRYLYVSDAGKHEVRRYQLGEKKSTLVAGGNGQGDGLKQLSVPTYLFVDRQQNVYVSDNSNHRVMKWNKGAKEGIVVAGGQGEGNALTQLYHPNGLFVDTLGTLYVSEFGNGRAMRWTQGDKKQGTVIVGGNGSGAGANQFNYSYGLSFDRQGNLYVVDMGNHRVQRFSIE